MTKQEAKKLAKAAGLYLAIEGLKNRLWDITDTAEAQAYESEIERLEAQYRKVAA
jgi:hypothetical protein